MFVRQTWVFWDELSLKQPGYEYYLSNCDDDIDSKVCLKRTPKVGSRRRETVGGCTSSGIARLFGLHIARRIVATYYSLTDCLCGDSGVFADYYRWVRSAHFSKSARVYLRR